MEGLYGLLQQLRIEMNGQGKEKNVMTGSEGLNMRYIRKLCEFV